MKKILIIVLMLFTLTGCFKNDVIPNEGKIVLGLEEKYYQYMPYKKEEIPNFVFEFDGTFNTIKNVSKPYYIVFAGNDDFKLSDEISKLLENYRERTVYVVQASDVQTLTRINSLDENGKQVAQKVMVDNQEIYDETAFIDLENGLKLTIDYRRFTSEGKTYYVWRYTQSLTMYLYYPMMIINDGGKKEVVLLTLPNRVTFQVGTTLDIDRVIADDKYLNDDKYTFNYLDDFENINDKKQQVIDYYVNGYNGKLVGNDLYFEYLNIRFKVTFTDKNFIIKYDSKI